HSGLLRRLPDAARHFIDDDVIVRGVAAQQASDADDGVIFSGFRKRVRGRGNFKSTRSADNLDRFFGDTRAQQTVKGALQQPLGYECIESGDNNPETLPSAVQAAL